MKAVSEFHGRVRRRHRSWRTWPIVACALALAVMAVSQAVAQTTQEAAQEHPAVEPSAGAATVSVDGQAVFEVIGISAYSAQERAGIIADRIVDVANKSRDEPILEIRAGDLGPGIFVDGTLILSVTAADAAFEGVDRDTLAAVIGETVKDHIAAYRARRTDTAITESVVIAAGWTLAFIVFAILLWLGLKFLHRRVDRRVLSWTRELENRTGKIVKTTSIVSMSRATLRALAVTVFLIALYYYLSQVLNSFPQTRGTASVLLEYFYGPILDVIMAVVAEIPNLLVLLIIFFILRYLLRIVRLIFENIELGFFRIAGFEPGWVWPTHRIAKVILIIFAIIFAFPYIPGSDTSAFKGISIFLGVILSLGSSSVVANLLAGIFVVYRRGVGVGDWIRIGDKFGVVEAIGTLETLVRSVKNELISIPNAQLLGSQVTNFSRTGHTEGVIVRSHVGIGYEVPQRQVESMLLEAARRTDGVKADPPPFVLSKSLTDYAVSYELNTFPERVDGLPRLESRLYNNILDVFSENNVQIMTPSYVADPETPKIAPAANATAKNSTRT